jgi:hypothetical protein
LIFGRTGKDRFGAYVAILPALALGGVGYLVFMGLSELTSRI